MHVTFDLNATEPVDWLKVSHIHIYMVLFLMQHSIEALNFSEIFSTST